MSEPGTTKEQCICGDRGTLVGHLLGCPAYDEQRPSKGLKPSRVLGKAISAARKKIRILSRKQLNQNLSFCCGDLADAFEAGVQEAQMDIVDRLLALEAKLQRASQPPGAVE